MLTGLLIFLLVVIALLAIPVAFEFRLGWPNDAQNEIVLVWANGLVRAPIPMDGAGKVSAMSGRPRRHGKRSRRRPTNVLAAIRQQPFRQRLYRFARDLWRAVTRDDIRLRARVGLGDPADTGQLWAIVGPISGMLAVSDEVVIEPDFVDAVFEFDGSGRLSLVPLHVIATLIGLLFSPAVWRGVRASRNS